MRYEVQERFTSRPRHFTGWAVFDNQDNKDVGIFNVREGRAESAHVAALVLCHDLEAGKTRGYLK